MRTKERGEERERRGDALTPNPFPHSQFTLSQFLLCLSSHAQTLLARACSQTTHPLPSQGIHTHTLTHFKHI